MRNGIIFIILVTGIIFSSACTSLRRYNSLKRSGTDSTLADINLFGSRLVQANSGIVNKSLWDLSADAQAQFIKILHSRYPDNELFLKSLSNEYMKNGKEPRSNDYVRGDLRLIFSVSKKRDYTRSKVCRLSKLSPADRIEYIKISLVLQDPCLKFKEWNMYTTEYGSIDIGDVSFNRSIDLTTAASSPEKKAESVGSVSAEVKSSISRKEDQSLKYRYLKLNGRLNEREIEMEEEGTREIDLTGNIIADVSLEFDKSMEMISEIKGLKDSSGGFNSPGKVSVDTYLVAVPDINKIKKDIQADLKMDFIYRNVKHGRRTFPEWDDRVKYYKGQVVKPVSLLKDSDYVPGFCCIGSGQGGKNKEFISLEMGNDNVYPLIFRTYEEAIAFYEWLKYILNTNEGKPVKIGDYVLKFNEKDLSIDHIIKEPLFGVVPYYW